MTGAWRRYMNVTVEVVDFPLHNLYHGPMSKRLVLPPLPDRFLLVGGIVFGVLMLTIIILGVVLCPC